MKVRGTIALALLLAAIITFGARAEAAAPPPPELQCHMFINGSIPLVVLNHDLTCPFIGSDFLWLVAIEGTSTIDLQGHTLTLEGDRDIVDWTGRGIIKNGTIIGGVSANANIDGRNSINGTGTTLDNVHLIGYVGAGGIGGAGSLTVRRSVIEGQIIGTGRTFTLTNSMVTEPVQWFLAGGDATRPFEITNNTLDWLFIYTNDDHANSPVRGRIAYNRVIGAGGMRIRSGNSALASPVDGLQVIGNTVLNARIGGLVVDADPYGNGNPALIRGNVVRNSRDGITVTGTEYIDGGGNRARNITTLPKCVGVVC